VRRWFKRNLPATPVTVAWSSPSSYETFVHSLEDWAAQLSATARMIISIDDDVGYLIFADQATSETSAGWSEAWVGALSDPEADAEAPLSP
jgi:hypothetical protein